MAYTALRNGHGDIMAGAGENHGSRTLRAWRDMGLVWKGAAAVLALGLLIWNLGAFAIPFRVAELERADVEAKADIKQLAGDVNVLKIDMASMKRDVASISITLNSFRDEFKAELRAGIAEMKAAVVPAPASTAAASPPLPQKPGRKSAKLAKPGFWQTITGQ